MVSPQHHIPATVVKALSKSNVQVAVTNSLCINDSPLDGTVTDMKNFSDTTFWQIIKCGNPVPFRNMILMSNETLEKIKDYLKFATKSIGLIGLILPKMNVLRIVKVENNPTPVVMAYESGRFNMQGLQLLTYNIPWFPYIQYKCVGNECNTYGTYPTILSLLGQKLNFSVKYQLEPSGNWGSFENLNITLSTLRSTLDGMSSFTFPWANIPERSLVFDYLHVGTTKFDMYMVDSGSKVTMNMFLKPFSSQAWISIMLFLGILTITHKFVTRANSGKKDSLGIKPVLAFFSWLLVTFVIAFYRSALIIALTAEAPIPFENFLEGLSQEKWNLVYDRGNQGLIARYFDLLPYSYAKKNAVLDSSYKYVSGDIEKNFRHLRDPKTYFIEDRERAVLFLRDTNCQLCKEATQFGRPEAMSLGFLFEGRSPLRDIFKVGLAQMRETGVIDHVMRSYVGPDYASSPSSDPVSLSIELMVLVFLFLACIALVVSPTILSAEYAWKRKFYNFQNSTRKCERKYEEDVCLHCGLKQVRQQYCID